MSIKNHKKIKEYVWHCPSEYCQKHGTIILKTRDLYLGNGKIKCPTCNKIFSLFDIAVYNKRNVKKYLETLTND